MQSFSVPSVVSVVDLKTAFSCSWFAMPMVRILQILSVGAILAAGGILALAVSLWRQEDPRREEICRRPSAVERFQESGGRGAGREVERSPLIAQAEILALYLDPPKTPAKPVAPVRTAGPRPALPPVRPAAPSVDFRLRGTSYYPNQPRKSMALVAEVGAAEGNERWVREGERLGHFVIQEIRCGSITYRDGANLREMSVEHRSSPPSLVRDLRPGSRQVSAAVEIRSTEAAGDGEEPTAQ